MKTYCPDCDAQTERVCFLKIRVPHFGPGTYFEAAKTALDRYEYEAPSGDFWDSVCDVCGEKYSPAWRQGFEDYEAYGDLSTVFECWNSHNAQTREKTGRDELSFSDYLDGWKIADLDQDEPLMWEK